ncbi:hypothetical protein H4582DRAFT_440031 [Lactarius indigo]|nr:hypothetical protein H4582DRAFT_440031 [Lactarius indigo]
MAVHAQSDAVGSIMPLDGTRRNWMQSLNITGREVRVRAPSMWALMRGLTRGLGIICLLGVSFFIEWILAWLADLCFSALVLPCYHVLVGIIDNIFSLPLIVFLILSLVLSLLYSFFVHRRIHHCSLIFATTTVPRALVDRPANPRLVPSLFATPAPPYIRPYPSCLGYHAYFGTLCIASRPLVHYQYLVSIFRCASSPPYISYRTSYTIHFFPLALLSPHFIFKHHLCFTKTVLTTVVT